jgi:AcrR family transcriptional regulator
MPATKDQIADAFWKLTERYGYRRTAVLDVARVLRISKKTVYDFFPDKETLFRFAQERWARGQRDRVEGMLTETSARGRLVQVARIAFSHAREGFAGEGGADLSEPSEIVDRVNTEVFGPLIRDLIEEGNAAGEFRVSRPDLAASFCVAVGTDAVRRLRNDSEGRDRDETEEEAIRAMLRILGASDREGRHGRD